MSCQKLLEEEFYGVECLIIKLQTQLIKVEKSLTLNEEPHSKQLASSYSWWEDHAELELKVSAAFWGGARGPKHYLSFGVLDSIVELLTILNYFVN